ncbi:MAG: hypothetical protein ACK4QL_08795 [Pseudanabaenaceae cyanobacterium]
MARGMAGFGHGNIRQALYHLWQVFAEPALAETYAPKAGNVFAAIDPEARRIGWQSMYHYGRVHPIRKTHDGWIRSPLAKSNR